MRYNKNQMLLVIASALWGLAPVLVKLLSCSLNVIFIVFIRFFIAFVLIWIICIVRRRKIWPYNISIYQKDILLPGFIGIGLGFGAYGLAIVSTDVVNATFTFYVYPIIISLYNKESRQLLTKLKILGMFIALLGVFILFCFLDNNQEQYFSIFSFIYPLLAAMCWSFYSVSLRNRHLSNLDSQIVSYIPGFMFLFCSLSIVGYDHITIQLNHIGIKEYFMLLVLGVFSTSLAFWLYFIAIRESIDPSILVVSYLTPIFTVMYSYLFLKENLNIFQFVGGVFIGTGILLSQKNLYQKN